MKSIALILSILLISSFHLFSQVQWESVQTPVSENLTAVWANNQGKIIIVSEMGTIGITEDNGATWQTVTIAGITEANCVSFLSNSTGIITGYYVNEIECKYTTDGGQSWLPSGYILVLQAIFYDASFRNENFGNIVGNDGNFYSTNNGGEIWVINYSFPIINLNAIYNYSGLKGVVVGDEGKTFFTVDDWYQHIDLNTNITENLNADDLYNGVYFVRLTTAAYSVVKKIVVTK